MENTIQSDLIRGHINTIILKALSDGDRYGYDIVREIEQKSSGQYKLKQPTLYSCLKRLEIQGFIRSYWGAKSNGGRRKYFTLTEMGRELFIKNQSEWEYSRTVIDKLISDREVDLSEYNNISATSQSESYEETIEEGEEFEEEEEVSEIHDDVPPTADENNENEQIDDVSNEELNKVLDELNDGENEDASESTTDSKILEETSEPHLDDEYHDVSDEMNELLKTQNDNSNTASYAERLTEEFDSDNSSKYFSSDDYFNDYYDANEQHVSPGPIATTEENNEYAENDEDIVDRQSYENAVADQQNSVEGSFEEHASEPQEERPRSPEFLEYHSNYAMPQRSNSEIIESEYRNILGDFLDHSFISRSAERSQTPPAADTASEPAPEENTKTEPVAPPIETYTNDTAVNRKLNDLAGEVREMGTDVKIRTHRSESAKEYNNAYYYYSNKLMLVHYGILFGIMAVEILFSIMLINLGIREKQAISGSTSVWFYVISVLIALAFPVFAFIKNLRNTDKRKRINFNLKNQLIYRFIVLAQCLLIIYCANVIGHMSVSFDIEYLTTLLLPALLCTNFPISALIFNALYKSGRYSVKD